MNEPIRMRETDQLPVELRDAFGTLGRDAPSVETVLRVQRALEALPAVTPAAAAVGTLGMSKLLVMVTLIAGAATSAMMLKGRLGATLFPRAPEGALRHTAEQTSATNPTPAPEPVVPPPASAENSLDPVSTQAAAPTDDRGSMATAAPEPRAARATGEAQRNAPRARARAVAGAKTPSAALSAQWAQSLVPSQPSTAQRAGAERGTASGQAVARPAERARSDEAKSDASSRARVASEPSPALPSLAVAQANEAQKLAQCKRLAAHDPADALRQLEALAREAPHGVFVEERELLEIRLHERLGQPAIAAELTQRFLARHPNSVYRRALSP
jgi:hypothetical protein